MRYAKLTDGELCLAPNPIIVGANRIGNPPEAVLAAQGYKPLREASFPENAPSEGFCWVLQWTESPDALIPNWVQLPLSPEQELSGEEVLDILLGGEAV